MGARGLADNWLDERVPAFALQTLVENAVRHSAAPRAAATEIVVTAAGSASELTSRCGIRARVRPPA